MHGPVPQLHDYIINSAARLPDKVAVVYGDARVTYAEIDARSNALANTLVSRGIERGDRVVKSALSDLCARTRSSARDWRSRWGPGAR